MYLKELIDLLKQSLKENGNRPVLGEISESYNVQFDLEILTDAPKKPKPSKWHRVEDELPDSVRMVLIGAPGKPITCGYYAPCGLWHFMDKDIVSIKVTHWRELPKPPKKGK